MPGIADLLYLGQPDPARQIAQMLSGQQPQPGQQGAAPPGANPPPPDGAAPAPGQPGQPQNPSPGDPPPPGSQPTPQAFQSTPQQNASYQGLANPPNLMSLYLQLQARDRAEDQINRGFALIAANHAGNPEMARAIMQSVSGGAGDAGGTVGNLMTLYNAQQGMAATQALLAQAPQIAQKLGLDEGTVRAEILAGRGPDLIKSMEPTEMARNYQWAHDTYLKNHPGASPEEVDAGAQSILLGAGGGGAVGGDLRSMNIARSNWLAQPANKDKPPPGYLTDVTKWKIYSQDLNDAKSQFGGMNQALGEFIDRAGAIGADPELTNITGSPANALKAKTLPYSTEGGKLASDINDLGGLAKAMASRQGPKGVGQNLVTIGANPEAITNFGMKDFGENVIAPRIRAALTAQANAYGAAGRVNEMPGYLRPYLDPMYQTGGDLDPGVGFKPFTPSKDPNIKQPSAEDMNDFKYNLEHFGPKKAIQVFKDAHIDTNGLE